MLAPIAATAQAALAFPNPRQSGACRAPGQLPAPAHPGPVTVHAGQATGPGTGYGPSNKQGIQNLRKGSETRSHV
jgi:hypothetical protein